MKEVKFADVDPTHSFVEPDLMQLSLRTKVDEERSRAKALTTLTDWIGTSDARPMLIVAGNGGMGKTTLVRQLAIKLQSIRHRIYPIS